MQKALYRFVGFCELKHAGESGGRGLSVSWVGGGRGQMVVVTTLMPTHKI